jgi:hypothetical protein
MKPSWNKVELTPVRLEPSEKVAIKTAKAKVMLTGVINGTWSMAHLEIDDMRPPSELLCFAAGNSIAGPQTFQWEIVDKRPWKAHSEILIQDKNQVRTILWLFPNRERIIE